MPRDEQDLHLVESQFAIEHCGVQLCVIGMKTFLAYLWRDERGQDLIEYTLMLAFVALASAALFSSARSSINLIWSKASSQLSTAASS
jgi:Flp pilus assembly pilin Flp